MGWWDSFKHDLGILGKGALAPFKSIFDLGKAGLDELEGNSDQARADASNAGYAWANPFREIYGMKDKNAMSAADVQRKAQDAAAAEALKKQQTYNTAVNPLSSWNRQNWASQSNRAAGSTYGAGVGNDNVRPSDLMKISDPHYKMLQASTRGKSRGMLMAVGTTMDLKAAPMLAGNPAMASDNNNSAGAEGHSTQVDQGQDQLKEPNTEPTGASHTSGVDAPSSPTGVENQSAPTPDVRS